MDSVATERQLGFDPAFRRAMVDSAAGLMVSSFCVNPDQEARCKRALTDSMLRASVSQTITEIEERRASVRSLADILARSVGHSLADVGWPSDVGNNIGVVRVPLGSGGNSVVLYTATGPVEMGRNVSRMLMPPGAYRVGLSENGQAARVATVEVRARALGELNWVAGGTDGLNLRLDPPASSFCFNLGDVRFEGPVGMFNWGRATFVEPAATKTQNLSAAAQAIAVSVVVDDRASSCGAQCAKGLGAALAEAIGTWKAGCERCQAHNMSVLQVGSNLWVDGRIASRLRAGTGKAPLDLSVQHEGDNSRGVPPSIVPGAKAVFGFEQLSGNQNLIGEACRLNPSAASWVPAVQAGVCGASWSGITRIAPVVRILPGETSCGPSKHFLACGLPNQGIELSVELDSFSFQGIDPPLVFGRNSELPPIDLRAVLLHEIGHWFGVPHFELTNRADKDIMAETYGSGRSCVSAVSLMMLNNATDLRWTYRVTEGKGLRRPADRQLGSSRR